jgi:hypothetical protein
MINAGSFDIREASNKLHESLQYNRVLEYRTIVLVAHSMGGLVVLRYLLNHRDLLERVPLIVLYATPQEGSQIATVAQLMNPAIEQMLPADRNGYLQGLSDEWGLLRARPHVSCGYEKLATYGVMIVPWASATRFCDGAPSAIGNADHIGIVKPDRAGHDSIVLLVNALNEFVFRGDMHDELAIQRPASAKPYVAPESMLLQQREDAQRIFEQTLTRYNVGLYSGVSEIISASNKLLEAELAVSSGPSGRVAAHEAALKRAKELESNAADKVSVGASGSIDLSETRLHRTQMEIGLAREQSKPEQ